MNLEQNPVLIIAADTIIGLTVLRALGRRGIPVYCARTIPDALGPQSVYCSGSFTLPSSPEAAIAAVREHALQWKVTHILGISENHITLLNRYRKELEEEYILLFPPQEIFERATRKNLTLECACRVGIPIPRTSQPQTMEEAEECRHMQFPVILKLAHHNSSTGARVAFQHQYLRVDTFENLRQALAGLPPGQFPMVQEYIPGHGVGMSMLIRNRKAVLGFQHRRIREYPPEGGVGVVCEAVAPERQLFEQSEALLLEMGWDGVAMVEYRCDPHSGRYALMEVNGRFWGSTATAVYAGADFPYWLYRTSFPGAPLPPTNYRVGVRARSLAGDTKWLLSVLRGRKKPALKATGEYLLSFHPLTRYFIWDWDDPKPGLHNFLTRFSKTRSNS